MLALTLARKAAKQDMRGNERVKGHPPTRAIRALSILAAGISSAAIIVLGLIALEVQDLIAERTAIVMRIEQGIDGSVEALRANLATSGQLVGYMVAAIAALAVSALAIPVFVQMLLREIGRQTVQSMALTDSEERLRAITDFAPDAIIMIDSVGAIQFWNPGAERLFGLSYDQVRGRDLHHLLALPEDEAEARAGLETFARTGTGPIVTRRRDVTARHADGSTFRAELSIAAVRQNNENWAVGLVRDVTAQHKAAEQLRELARTDSLTGLINRREFIAIAAEEIARARRYGRPVSFLAIDLDNFKRVNDTHGHAAGDAVLEDFAVRLRAGLRSHDIAGRVGGEEFMAVLPETTAGNAMLLARRLCTAIAAEPARHKGTEIPCTISIGVSGLAPAPANPHGAPEDHEALLLECMAHADAGLYAAKAAGRNRAAIAPGKAAKAS